MNRIYCSLFILFFVSFAQAQTISSSCEAGDSLKEFYIFDATKLAIRELYKTNSEDTSSIIVNNTYTDEMLKPLLAVHQAIGLVARDEVVDFYNIHVLSEPVTNSFVLYADTSHSWAKQWLAAEIFTEEENIDMWVDSLELFFPNSPEMIFDEVLGQSLLKVQIQTKQHLNLSPLLKEFLAVDGILKAETEHYQGEVEKNIEYELNTTQNYVDLTYQYGWGNCTGGCSNEHFWIFRVHLSDCSVEFISDGGTPLLTNSPSQISQISLQPNPTTGFTSVKLVGPANVDFLFRLHDAYGQIIESRALGFHNGLLNLQVDLSPLPVGVYFITFSQGDQVLTKRVLKI
ncbi:MAG: hypothetical protein ACI8YQ_004510 [Polaribacter sp.]|jgi:hypothetical protein